MQAFHFKKYKTMKYFILNLFLIIIFFNTGFTQSIDEVRMQRDIEVAENVLESIWTQQQKDQNMLLVSGAKSQQFDGLYIEDYGVIFRRVRGLISSYVYTVPNNNYRFRQTATGAVIEKIEESDEEESKLSLRELEQSAIEIFFSDYASLISQLKPSDRITIRIDNNDAARFFTRTRIMTRSGSSDEEAQNENESFSASILKKDIDAYKSQQITHEAFLKKIDYVNEAEIQKKEPELELLASLLHRLYKGDLSDSFTMRSAPRYERLKALGVIYHLSFQNKLVAFLTTSGDTVTWNYPEKNKKAQKELSFSQRVELLQKEIPQHLIEYGRLLKNLAPKESLIFKVVLPKCKNCDSPREMEFSVSQSVLSNYDRNQISLDQALQQVKITIFH